MKNSCSLLKRVLLLAAICVLPINALSAVTDLADGPLASGTTSSTAIKPNIAFIVDDSGSMDDEFMPEDVSSNSSKRCYGWYNYNTVFYNPAYTYKPPYKPDGAIYSDGVPRYPDASFTAALRDGYFPAGGYTYAGSRTSNSSINLSDRTKLTTPAVNCDTASSGGGSGATATLTITVPSGATNTKVTDIRVNGVDIFDGETNSTKKANTLASYIAARVTLNGYSATASGNVVTLQAPLSAGNVTATPVVTKNATGNLVITATAFSGYVAPVAPECTSSPSRFYYSVHKTNANSTGCDADANYYIVTDPQKIGAPGVPESGRTAAQIAQAQTNYANWYSYYRKRAYLMKAATAEAFKDLDENKFRAGLFFINSKESNSGYRGSSLPNSDLAIADFSGSASGTHRYNWFKRLYENRSAGWTPLRGALSRAGRMFAGKVPGFDPVQYSCQQNFAILSTDGYWNTNYETTTYGPFNLSGNNVGDQDKAAIGAVSAKSTLQLPTGTNMAGCYQAESISVSGTQLLAQTVPASCVTKVDDFGEALKTEINANTAAGLVTGFSAEYNATTNILTLTAPASLGNITVTPQKTFVRISGSVQSFNDFSAFSGGVTAVAGATIPYADKTGTANSLADVAYYYYTTDLRTEALGNCSNTIGGTTYNNLCKNNVLGSGKDLNEKQHMTTFTIGLGVSGTVRYEPNYEASVPIPGVTNYHTVAKADPSLATTTWPNTRSDAKKIDDLWHAAVNGRGTYYSAGNAQTLKEGIQSALSGVQARIGSSAAAATSNLEPVAGDNYVYVALYRTLKWDGDIKALTIDPDTGAIGTEILWSAQSELDDRVNSAGAGNDGRTIKYFSPAATDKLKDFTLANLEADGLVSHFTGICSKTPAIDQCGADPDDLTSSQRSAANEAANLVNYLRGQATYEDETANLIAANRIYRGREHVFGDIINAVPVYMKKPPFSFGTFDTSYTTFTTDNALRAATVYAAANDGMLHAINAENGEERWAYVPSKVIPNLWKLADRNYSNNHKYYTDGSPTIADICSALKTSDSSLCKSASDWKTILVAGFNKGGCGYYALDVTDPTNPKGLWEFSDNNLGLSYGNPVVGKLKNGTWVVVFSSGYNNVPGNGCGNTGDGNGRVYVLNAYTGAKLYEIQTYTSGATPAGTTTTPSGLGKLNAWISNADLPIIDRVYGGDMLGNVWRFDIDDNYANSGREATLLATLKDDNGQPQPITTKPELAEVTVNGTTYPVVLVGTGRYLGNNDITDTSQQSVYALKDALTNTGISDVRGSTMVRRTMTETTGSAGSVYEGRTIRTVSGDPMTWNNKDGWYVDLISSGERVNVDMSLQFNILTFAGNVPSSNVCDVGGYAYLYFLDINTGLNLSSAADSAAGVLLPGNALVAGIKTVRLQSGKTVTIVTDTAGNVRPEENPSATGGGAGGARRTMWREIED